jgi:hypothetical protein
LALFSNNTVRGGGVAGVLVHGKVRLVGNRFIGQGGKQGSAIWVWDKSEMAAHGNEFAGYRNAVNAGGSAVVATNNIVRGFQGTAIIVRKSTAPAHVFGNTAFSQDPQATAAQVDTPGVVADNVVKTPPVAAP